MFAITQCELIALLYKENCLQNLKSPLPSVPYIAQSTSSDTWSCMTGTFSTFTLSMASGLAGNDKNARSSHSQALTHGSYQHHKDVGWIKHQIFRKQNRSTSAVCSKNGITTQKTQRLRSAFYSSWLSKFEWI